jgi:shikimate kinase
MKNRVKNLNEFLDIVKEIKSNEKQSVEWLYRGHGDKSYRLKASIYRNENLADKESKIY